MWDKLRMGRSAIFINFSSENDCLALTGTMLKINIAEFEGRSPLWSGAFCQSCHPRVTPLIVVILTVKKS